MRLCLTALLSLVASMPANADAFLAENSDGVSICYAIVSYDDRTVEVTSDFNGSLYSGSVNIPTRVREGMRAYLYKVIGIGDRAFYNCTGLTEVTLPNSVTSIGDAAFEYTGLKEVTIPGSVTSIGVNAFGGCRSLTKIEVAEDSKYFCSKDGVLFTKDMTELLQCPCALPLASYDIPDGVTTIGTYAFNYCTGLTSVTIPNSVTEIGRFAFQGCTGLTEVTIPNSVTEIGNEAFYNCTGLTELNFNATACTSAGSSSYGRAFDGCTNISTVNIGESVTIIPGYLCYGLTGLTEVTIPESVTSIGSSAFYGCTGLTEVTIPNSVTEIGGSAFNGCSGLKSITSLNPTPPSCDGSYVFSGVPTSTCVLYVPRGSKAAYSTAGVWRSFVNIVEMGVYSPTVQTGEATEITYNSATLNATITAGSEEILEQGFEYWFYAEEKNKQTILMNERTMSATPTGLRSDATYDCRAYAVTASGTTYGNTVRFNTNPQPQTGIEDILSARGSDDTWIYNLAGRRVLTTGKGGVYIFRNPDGTIRKEVVK